MNSVFNVGIIGMGFVGTALESSFSQYTQIKLSKYDKYKNIGDIESILSTEMVFLCLPTPYSETLQTYDLESFVEICGYLQKNSYRGSVVVKSTLAPGTSEKMAQEYDLPLIHNPEFLTARTACIDFHNQSHIILGSTSRADKHCLARVHKFYQTFYPNAVISLSSSTESESVKILCNSFYAMKVQICSEFYLLCQKLGISWDLVRDLMLGNGWINPMHTTIPGPDGNISYGGLCFPKDTQALLAVMKSMETPHLLLEACIKERDSMRN